VIPDAKLSQCRSRKQLRSVHLSRMLATFLILVIHQSPAHVIGDDKAADSRWNVLFIAVDDMRAELGCYGDSSVTSPHIDALAERGTLFERAYCQQAVCNPSRASLLTGLRPDTIGIWDLPTHFRDKHPELVTLPQHFLQQGYFTQNIGKIFHNWRQDAHEGDAPSWSVPAVLHYNSHGNDQPVVAEPMPPNLSAVPRTEMRDVPDSAYFDGRIADLAVQALDERHSADEPFFLAVGFWKPHAPFNAPTRYWDLYSRPSVSLPVNPDPPFGVPDIAMHDSREILRGFKSKWPNEEQTRTLRHGYYAGISYVDAQIGKLLGAVNRLDLWKNTVVVFWSDHGFHLGEHHLWAKTSNFELDARVPLIIATPSHTGGQRTSSLVELIDLYPTLTDLCRLPPVSELDGVSLVPVLDDPSTVVKDGAMTQHTRPAYPPKDKDPDVMGYSLRTDSYRYTEWRDFHTGELVASELYDHVNDPRETVNVADQAEHSDLVRELARQLRNLRG